MTSRLTRVSGFLVLSFVCGLGAAHHAMAAPEPAGGTKAEGQIGARAATTVSFANQLGRDRRSAPAQGGAKIAALEGYTVVDLVLPEGIPSDFEVLLPLAGEDRRVLSSRVSLRSPDLQVFVDIGGGVLVPVEAPPHRTYRGFVEGISDGGAALNLIDGRLFGLIDLGEAGGRWFVQPASDLLPDAPATAHVLYAARDVRDTGFSCGVGSIDLALPEWMQGDPLADPGATGLGGSGSDEGDGGVAGNQPSVAEIAFDADFEFFQKNGNSVANTINDIELVMNGVDFIYDRDVDIAYEFTVFVIRSTSDDPYTTTNMGDLLCEFRSTWNSAPEVSIRRDIAQLYTGKTIQGNTIGLAWLGVVCNQNGNDCGSFGNLAYNSVESRFSLVLGNRQALSAHELGHNWSATHCDGSASCHIMCATLGGCSGIGGGNLKFGPNASNQIIAYRNGVSCDPPAPLPLQPPFFDAFPNTSIDTTKWSYIDGATTSTAAIAPPSSPRVLRLNAAGAGIYQGDEIRSNRIQLGGLANVELSYWTQANGLEAGERLFVDYWSSGGDWLNINTLVATGVNETVFTQWIHSLPANARHNGFRLRFRVEANETNDNWYVDDVQVAEVVIPIPSNDECITAEVIGAGSFAFNTLAATDSIQAVPAACNEGNGTAFRNDIWYLVQAPCTGTLTVSTCGSANFDTRLAAYSLFAGCPLSGATPLACSDNAPGCANATSRMELQVQAGLGYYIRLGGATGGGTGTLTVTCQPLVVPCPADLNGDNVVNGADLATLLAAWGVSPAGDLNGDNQTDAADLAILLASWGACP